MSNDPSADTPMQKKEPKTDHDWTIHSLNIHGLFFQRKCEEMIRNQRGWKVELTEYPVEYPPYGTGPSGSSRTAESALDIYAEHNLDNDRLTLLIECKKNNPEFVDWIFFLKQNGPSSIRYTKIDTHGGAPGPGRWTANLYWDTHGLNDILANEARESRGSYLDYQRNDRTKTANAAITGAARQVALATQAIKQERIDFLHTMSNDLQQQPKPFDRQVFLPVIATTARLFTCDFDPDDVSADDGEIPLDKATLTERDWLYYEYPMSRALYQLPANAVTSISMHDRDPQRLMDIHGRMHILVVQGKALPELLTALVAARENLMA
jgi:hypothetical protein